MRKLRLRKVKQFAQVSKAINCISKVQSEISDSKILNYNTQLNENKIFYLNGIKYDMKHDHI